MHEVKKTDIDIYTDLNILQQKIVIIRKFKNTADGSHHKLNDFIQSYYH